MIIAPRKVAIVGSREFPYLYAVAQYVRELPPGTIIVSGGARGVDSVAVRAAARAGLGSVSFFPDWGTYGRAAGFIRNATIVDFADRVVAFWYGRSRGTRDSIERAERAGKPVSIAAAGGRGVGGIIWGGAYRYDW